MPQGKKPFSINSFSTKITVGQATDTRFWSKVSGIKKTYQTSEYSDGQTNILLELPTAVKYDDVTISKPFTEDDSDIYGKLITVNAIPDQYVNVEIQPMYRDAYYTKSVGGILMIMYCIVKSATIVNEIDTGGNAVAMMEAVLSPGLITSQGSTRWWDESSTDSVIA